MANYTTTITNEGAALLASVIANQGTLTFNEFRFSENDYTGQESTLTEVTFLGVFITASAAASVIDLTTIKASAQFDNSTITGNHDLYSIGIIGTDGNTTALIAVCTTTDPDVIREPLTGTSTYAFNVNLSVSDTSQITVVGTTAAVIYDIDVVDNLISPATNKPLSANQGRLVADNLAADEESGAKNRNVYPYKDTTKTENGVTFTDNGNGTITVSAASYPYTVSSDTTFYCSNFLDNEFKAGTWTLNGSPIVSNDVFVGYILHYGGEYLSYLDKGQEVTFTQAVDTDDVAIVITLKSGYVLAGALLFKPMIRDARIIDPTFVPFAETNLQLTQNKAERNDLSTIHATGSTNTTGAQINAGTFFYLNGQFCKALTNIAVNATFTLNTNFKVDSVGEEIKAVENKDTSSFSVSTESGVSLQKAICRNGFVYLQLYFPALANSTKIATITDANYLPEGGAAIGLIEPNLPAEKINYTYGSFSGSNVYVYVSGSPTSGGIITFVYPVTGY